MRESMRRSFQRAMGRSRADRGIGRISASLIAVAVLCTGVASYTYLHDLLVRDRSRILEAELDRRSQQVTLPLRAHAQMANALAARNHTAEAMRIYQSPTSGKDERTTAMSTLKLTASNLMRAGRLRAIELRSLQGDRLAPAVQLRELPRLSVPLSGGRDVLYWDDGFFLRVSSDVLGEDGIAGTMIADLKIPDADAALTGFHRLGETGEVALCGLDGARKICFPSRFQPAGRISPAIAQATRPTDRALNGERGTLLVTDYRGRATYSSFQPLDGLGLALVVKVDEDELLQPIHRQVQWGLPLLILLAAAGAALIRSQLKPLTAELVDAKRRADTEVASRAAAEAEIRVANRRLQTVADNASFLIAFLDPQFIFRFANRAHAQWFRRPLGQIIGRPMAELVGPVMFGEYRQAMAAALAMKMPQSVFRETRRDGESRFVEITFVAQMDEDGAFEGYCLTARDATEAVLREKTLLLAARRDPLTGLCNRTSFTEQLDQALRSIDLDPRPLAVAYLDIDHFKRVNDNFGHDVGDELLKALGKRIESTLKHSDTVARIGGDEFALIMPQLAAPDDVFVVASRILASIRQPVVIGPHCVRVTASIGFAVAGPRDTAATLLGRADRSLYEVKRNGRNGALRADGEGNAECVTYRDSNGYFNGSSRLEGATELIDRNAS